MPFSVGPRVCAGQAFGLNEAILCLATLAQRVRLRLAPGARVEPVCRLTLRPGDSLPMLIEHRAAAGQSASLGTWLSLAARRGNAVRRAGAKKCCRRSRYR